jgi:hypothetical protein
MVVVVEAEEGVALGRKLDRSLFADWGEPVPTAGISRRAATASAAIFALTVFKTGLLDFSLNDEKMIADLWRCRKVLQAGGRQWPIGIES